MIRTLESVSVLSVCNYVFACSENQGTILCEGIVFEEQSTQGVIKENSRENIFQENRV